MKVLDNNGGRQINSPPEYLNKKKSTYARLEIIKHLKFTSLSLLIISGIQRTRLIVITSLREDDHPAARKLF